MLLLRVLNLDSKNLLWNFFHPYLKMMASSKPKHCYQIFSYSDLGVLVGSLWEGASNLNVVLSESRRGKNDEQKWRKKNRKAAPEREIDGLQENVSEAKRSKKDVYIYSSMQSAHVYVSKPSVMYSRQQWWMHPFSVTTLNFASPSTILLLADQAEPLHYSLHLLFWKWAALRMNLWSHQHKSGQNWEWRS